MKDLHDYQRDLASIRSAMERSVKFLSLSGLSGVMAGIYALAGTALAYFLIYYPGLPFGVEFSFKSQNTAILQLAIIAATVLALAIVTAIVMSIGKAKRMGTGIWNKPSKDLLFLLGIPLVTGGLLILILLAQGYFSLIAAACLLFYGLALINASSITVIEIRYLGFSEIVLGLAAALLPGYDLIFWAAGFGVLHILYGAVMHYRYDS
jgi:hypothetical protein